MTFYEALGIFWIAFTSLLGNLVIGYFACRGAKRAWNEDKRDRQAQRAFEHKAGRS